MVDQSRSLPAIVRAWFLGLQDGFTQGELTFGMTYDSDPTSPRSIAYDRGANIGERFAQLIKGGRS